MIIEWIGALGAWSWVILGLVMLVLELLAPGVFFMWMGAAALIVGGASLAFAGNGAEAWGWQAQVLTFLVLSVILAYAGRSWLARREKPSDEPMLNNRVAQLIGRTATLEQPITNGVGHVRLGDTLWRVQGPDLPAGTTVRVSGGNSDRLEIERA
ncbi:NfeD family protein [Oricola sp.]|uniref:NfeD family protein n=1 Tax=Oricola sp. TaxID=1979950 RepID=UPI0025D2EA26|nr:NfeD family protein [Oricola sp.]MCI5074674.1 NfeD family protein [Oricola sp.]